MFASWYNYKTHCHVTGTPQSGKSKFIDLCIREKVKRQIGVTLFDWHGKAYNEMLRYLAYMKPKQPIYLLNLSKPDYILPYDPFALPEGWDLSAHVARITELVIKAWGTPDSNQMPTYERNMKMLATYAALARLPLHLVAKLLEYPKRELREHAIAITEGSVKQNWTQLQYLSLQKGKFDSYLKQIESTQNRLERFIGSNVIRLFTGLGNAGDGFSISNAWEENAIVLVNLAPSNMLAPESGRLFAALLLAGYLQTALDRAETPKPHFIYLDECQNYLSLDAAAMLDQVPKSGLRMTLVHHHLGQFHDNIPLQESIKTDARCKVVFGGLPVRAAKEAAEEFFNDELNERMHKQTRHRTEVEFVEELTSGTTVTKGTGPGGDSESTSDFSGSHLIPIHKIVEDGFDDYTMEEKISKFAARFLALKISECYIKVPHNVYQYKVPFIRQYLLNPDKVLGFMQEVHKHHIPLHEAEKILEEKERAFLERRTEYQSSPGRPAKKRPARLHPQS